MADLSVEALKEIQDLFGLSHDLIAQAQYPGHLGEKTAAALRFLKFQYEDFERRVKALVPPAVVAVAPVVEAEVVKPS